MLLDNSLLDECFVSLGCGGKEVDAWTRSIATWFGKREICWSSVEMEEWVSFFSLSLLANKSWLWKFVAPDRFFFHKTEKNYKHFVLILTGELCTIQSQWWTNLKTPNLTIVAVCIILASFFYIRLAFSVTTIDILQIFLMFFVFQVSQQNIIVQLEIVQIQSTNVEIKSDF